MMFIEEMGVLYSQCYKCKDVSNKLSLFIVPKTEPFSQEMHLETPLPSRGLKL
jgi:hypothetical protein